MKRKKGRKIERVGRGRERQKKTDKGREGETAGPARIFVVSVCNQSFADVFADVFSTESESTNRRQIHSV